MDLRIARPLGLIALLLGTLTVATSAMAQSGSAKEQISGTWKLVSWKIERANVSTIVRVTPPDLNTHVCAPRGPWKTKPIHCMVLGFGA